MARWVRALVAGLVATTAMTTACGPQQPSSDVTSPVSAPPLGTTSPAAAPAGATATGPDVADMCERPQQPIAAAYDRTSGEFRWVACDASPGFRFLDQVTEDAVYLLDAGPTRTVAALDPASGRRIEAPPPPAASGGIDGEPGGPYTTVVDGVTVTGGQDDPITATGADGDVIWERPGHWTYDDVAAIDDGAVFALEQLDDGSARLVGYEIDDGEVRWEASGSPYVEGLWPWLASDGQLFTGWANLQARSTDDGSIIWTTRWMVDDAFAPGVVHVAGVAVDDHSVYVGLVSESGPGD